MIRTILGAGALVLAAATPAAAQEARTARFQVTGVEIVMPIPKDFCLPEGDGVAVAQMLAAADTTNVTHLTLDRCGSAEQNVNYYLLKTTRSLLGIAVSRKEWIAMLLRELDDPAVKNAFDPDTIKPDVERDLAAVIGQKASIDGTIQWLGHDDVCVYLGGVLSLTSGSISYKRAVSGCMTAVGGRSINIYRYSEGTPANVTKYMSDVKAMALSMRGAPAH